MKVIATVLTLGLMGVGMSGGMVHAQEEPNVVQSDPVALIMRAAGVDALMQIVATEGARHGVGLESSFFPGKGGTAWRSEVSRIQSPERLVPLLKAALDAQLVQADVPTVAGFLNSDLGQRVIKREIAARREMLDAKVEAGAKEAAAVLFERSAPRAMLIDEFIAGLGLLEQNVSGGLNANFAFFRGLGDGGAFKLRMTEREMITLVWDQEDAVRQATTDWLRAYLMLAYTPLSDAELRSYLAFATTDAGRRYTGAMFAGYGRVFEATSYDLGRAAARFIKQDAT